MAFPITRIGGSGKTKRTKTFTGCWTCRSRGVKCDEKKPGCIRCNTLSLVCGGYGVGLVWPGDKQVKQRRVLLDKSWRHTSIMSDMEVRDALEILDMAKPGEHLSMNLFGVFPTVLSDHALEIHGEAVLTAGAANRQGILEASTCVEYLKEENGANQLVLSLSTRNVNDELVRYDHEVAEIPHRVGTFRPQVMKLSAGLDCLNTAVVPMLERQLMHYWASTMSDLLVPTKEPNNPFKAVFIPLALSSVHNKRSTSGHTAFLYSIYALSAYGRMSLNSNRPLYWQSQGFNYLQKSLRYLNQSFIESIDDQQEAILGTITALAMCVVVIGDSSDWRIHMRGGISFLNSIDRSIWIRSPSASIMYQIFLSLETFRPAHVRIARDLEPQPLLSDAIASQDAISGTHELYICKDRDYILDRLWGVSKPIMECIILINRYVFQGFVHAKEDVMCLQSKILSNNPTDLLPSSSLKGNEQMRWHHACIFYFACHIYFCRALIHTPVGALQHLVRQCLEHIEASEARATLHTGTGILWPAFITACEADEDESRTRVLCYFDKRANLCIGNYHAAKRVILEVWRRRDCMENVTNVLWHEVMADLQIDILLS
jgi:arginine metabolism regulation protein II